MPGLLDPDFSRYRGVTTGLLGPPSTPPSGLLLSGGTYDPRLPGWGARFGSDAPITTGLLATVPASGLLAPPQAELRSYRPTPRERLRNQFIQFFGGGPRGADAADEAMRVVGITPIEAGLSAYDGAKTLGGGLVRGDIGDIARGVAGIGLAGLQAALPSLFGRASTLTSAAEAPEILEGRLSGAYNPADLPQMPFTRDYPSGASADEQGRLTQDVKGKPLTAPYIAGRRSVGGPDEAVTDFGAIGKATTGRDIVVTNEMRPGATGRTVLDKAGVPQRIEIRAGLPRDEFQIVLGHEVSHTIDELAGQIPTNGLGAELRRNYNQLRNPDRRPDDSSRPAFGSKQVTPETFGYPADDVSREQMAEAIRAYMTNPNYVKIMMPKTAARIRAAVNSNPYLSKIIQFNGIAAAPVIGGSSEQNNSGQ